MRLLMLSNGPDCQNCHIARSTSNWHHRGLLWISTICTYRRPLIVCCSKLKIFWMGSRAGGPRRVHQCTGANVYTAQDPSAPGLFKFFELPPLSENRTKPDNKQYRWGLAPLLLDQERTMKRSRNCICRVVLSKNKRRINVILFQTNVAIAQRGQLEEDDKAVVVSLC